MSEMSETEQTVCPQSDATAPPEALARASKLCRSTIPGARVELIFQHLQDAQVVHKWLVNLKIPAAAPVTAPVSTGENAQFAPPAEDALHTAICQAVQEHHGPSANAILRTALNDYKPTQLTRSELIRVQQRSGAKEVTAVMVSPAATSTTPDGQRLWHGPSEEMPSGVEIVAVYRNTFSIGNKRDLEMIAHKVEAWCASSELVASALRTVAVTPPPAVTEAGEQEDQCTCICHTLIKNCLRCSDQPCRTDDHPYFVHAKDCATCGPDGFCSEGLRLYTGEPSHPLIVREHYHVDTLGHIAKRRCSCSLNAPPHRFVCAVCVGSERLATPAAPSPGEPLESVDEGSPSLSAAIAEVERIREQWQKLAERLRGNVSYSRELTLLDEVVTSLKSLSPSGASGRPAESTSVQCDHCALSTWAVPDTPCIKQAISGVGCGGTMRAVRTTDTQKRELL